MAEIRFSTGIFIAIGAIFSNGVSSQCPSDTTVISGYRLKRIDYATFNEDAISSCNRDHNAGYLVLIQNDESENAVEKITRGCRNTFYIGLKYETSVWYWNDGTLLTETQSRWQEGEGESPDGLCAWLSSLNQTWIDGECSTLNGYICQTDLLKMIAQPEVWALLDESVTLTVGISSVDGPVNISVFKNPNDGNEDVSIYDESNVETSFEYLIKNATKADAGTYRFVGMRDGYERSTTSILYIQDLAAIINEIPKQISSPVTRGPDYISCNGKGIPPPTVNWARNGIAVKQDQDSAGVYQSISDSKSSLHFEDALSSDDGVYVCTAVNVIGSTDTRIIDTRQTKLRVYGSPTIIGTNVTSCVGDEMTISLLWIPNNQTLGITHAIEVKSDSSNIYVSDTPVDSNSVFKTEISGLNSKLLQVIKIIVCPDDCIETLNDNTTFSAEIPGPVTNAEVVENNVNSESLSCTVSWIWDGTPYPESGVIFKVKQSSTLVNMREPAAQVPSVVTHSTPDYLFNPMTKPNSKYTFDIYVSNCAGDSGGTRAEGRCATDVAAPTEIQPASTNYSGIYTSTSQEILITIPDESHGLISCLFLMAKLGGETEGTVTWDDLQILSETSSSTPTNGDVYIAVAIPMSDVYHQPNYVIALGDARETSCDVYQHSNSRNQKNSEQTSVINGINWALDNGVTYGVSVVSTTPSISGEVFVKQSENASLEHEFVEVNDVDLWWISVVVIGGIMIVAASIVILKCVKLNGCRNVKTQRDKAENTGFSENNPRLTNQSFEENQDQEYDVVIESSVYETVIETRS